MSLFSAHRRKLAIFLLLAGAVILLFILATSLSQVELEAGQPFRFPDQVFIGQSAGEEPSWVDVFLLVAQGILAIVLLLAPILLLALLLTRQGRKQLLKILIRLIILWLLFMALRVVSPPIATEVVDTLAPGALSVGRNEQAPLLEFTGSPPEWVTWVAGLVVAAILALSALGAWRLFRPPRTHTALQKLATRAQNAIEQLESGQDLRDTILRCYKEMVQVVQESRGIAREQHMTPHEFEMLLARQGLPAESLARLTQLFEEVRYGSYSARPQETQLAIMCLQDIVAACHEGKTHAS